MPFPSEFNPYFMVGNQKSNRHMPLQSPVPEEELEATYEYRPFYVDPIVAWRAWGVLPHREMGAFALRSVTYNVFWPPRKEIKATCLAGNGQARVHDAPSMNHGCGIYSVKNFEDAIRWALHGTSLFKVIGQVKIWGRVLQYELGYISEFAYPSLVLISGDTSHWHGGRGELDAEPEEIAFVLEESYRIPVEVSKWASV